MSSVDEIKTFSAADYAVFAGMLCISTTIGVYYAWAVSMIAAQLVIYQAVTCLVVLRTLLDAAFVYVG